MPAPTPAQTPPPAGWHDLLRQADGAGAARRDQIRVEAGHQPYRRFHSR